MPQAGPHGRHLVLGHGVQQGHGRAGLDAAERVNLLADPVVPRNGALGRGQVVLHHEFDIAAQNAAAGVDDADRGLRSIETRGTPLGIVPGQARKEAELDRSLMRLAGSGRRSRFGRGGLVGRGCLCWWLGLWLRRWWLIRRWRRSRRGVVVNRFRCGGRCLGVVC